MPVVDADLILRPSLNMPSSDSGTSGGAIDPNGVCRLTALISPAGALRVVSTSASDTQDCTLIGYLADGRDASETLTLTGTTPRVYTTSLAFLQKVTFASNTVGTVTIEENASGDDIAVIPPANDLWTAMFENAFAEASGGNSRDHYYKIFLQNTNASLAYLGVTVSLTAAINDTVPNTIVFALDAARNGTTSSTNRITAPDGLTFNTSAKAVPGTDLEPAGGNDRIGIWLRYRLAAGTSPAPFTFSVTHDGKTR